MTVLARQVCLNHPSREAGARCVECQRFFCRECIAEHDGRLVCAGCLGKLARQETRPPRTWPRTLAALTKAVFGFIFAWFCFYSIGATLLRLPSRFHEQGFWNSTWTQLQQAGDD
jgi:hypothetical protein